MTDHGLTFKDFEILALLREAKEPGTGKTQTRRLIEQPHIGADLTGSHWLFCSGYKPTKAKQPYMEAVRPWGPTQPNGKPMGWEIVVAPRRVAARPGDRVWCRETWWIATRYSYGSSPDGGEMPSPPLAYRSGDPVHYGADGNPANCGNRTYGPKGQSGWYAAPDPYALWLKKPSIHMPRWASRLTLYVSEVRVQRLQDICEADARAEGAYVGKASGRVADNYATMAVAGHWFASARGWYADLWERLNGPGSWQANPWVAAYTFVPRLGNIDTLPAALPAALMEDA